MFQQHDKNDGRSRVLLAANSLTVIDLQILLLVVLLFKPKGASGWEGDLTYIKVEMSLEHWALKREVDQSHTNFTNQKKNVKHSVPQLPV